MMNILKHWIYFSFTSSCTLLNETINIEGLILSITKFSRDNTTVTYKNLFKSYYLVAWPDNTGLTIHAAKGVFGSLEAVEMRKKLSSNF